MSKRANPNLVPCKVEPMHKKRIKVELTKPSGSWTAMKAEAVAHAAAPVVEAPLPHVHMQRHIHARDMCV